MRNIDSELHVRGKSRFVDDLPVPEGTLHAAVFSSPIAHGEITQLDTNAAERMEGIHAILTAKDIPGDNQLGNTIPDEPLLATGEVHYVGQPIAIVVGERAAIVRKAARAINLEYREYPAIFDSREAYAQGQLIVPPITSSLGDIDEAWRECDVVVEGRAESGGQEHLYLETQGTLALPTENGGLKLISGTQAPGTVQQVAARVLGLPMHKIEVDVLRLGGGFGGKEEQATPWAMMAALAAFKLNRAVKLILRRNEDMRMTGKRHPYSSDFRIGLTHEGKILAYQATFYQNAGAAADLSVAVLTRSLFHATNSYYIPNIYVTGNSCRTNLPPNTAFRGFGTPQAAFVMESAIFKAAEKMKVEPHFIQKKNLLHEGAHFHYGMKAENSQAQRCWEETEKTYRIEKMFQSVRDFNLENQTRKKGLAMMPICYGISFEKAVFLNQGYALVHIYNDGSVALSTGAIEMGQGVSTKMRQVVADIFSIPSSKIKIESANTTRVANTSPTSSSFSADLNGHATQLACLDILSRLKGFVSRQFETEQNRIKFKNGIVHLQGRPTELTWDKLILEAYLNRINLSSQAHYSTPRVYFDEKKNKGRVYAYHVYGTAIIEATVDCLRGNYEIDTTKVVHDFGDSLNPVIDLGQAEGAIVQGVGWMTMEEVIYNEKGNLMSDTLSTYKIPDIYSSPREIQVSFLENSENPHGIFNSKGIGEPPFLYGIGAYFAIVQAMRAFKPEIQVEFSAPLTPEKVLLSLYSEADSNEKLNTNVTT